jgi:endonuclease G, mitochondrial
MPGQVGQISHSELLKRLARGRGVADLMSDRMLAQEQHLHELPGLESTAKPDVRGAFGAAEQGRPMTDAERYATEAIIFPELRPAIDIINDSYGKVTHKLWTHLSTDAALKSRLEAAIRSVGRIELPSGPLPYAGTGFVVGPGRVMTNRHVAEIFASGLGDRSITFKPGLTAGFDLKRERGFAGKSVVLTVKRVLLIHPYWDCAVLEVEGLPVTAKALTLSAEAAPDLEDREIAVIGYPAFDPRNPADVQDDLFDSVFRIKRLQPGLLDTVAGTASFGKLVPAIGHDASTLGGNSGSGVIELATGKVLALHFGGSYRERNNAVPADALSADARLHDAGVTFEAPRPTKAPAWEDWWTRSFAGEAPSSTAKTDRGNGGTSDPGRASAPAGRSGLTVTAAGSGAVSVTIPLTITVSLGEPGAAAAKAVTTESIEADTTEKLAMPWRDEDFSDREGYDPSFLADGAGAPVVPPPQPSDESVLARTKDGEPLLHYQNFSVAMHAARRLALFTASNVTAEPKLKRPESGKVYTRKALSGLGDNDQEQWFTDPRLDDDHQLPDYFYTRDDANFDKGHIVRRDDVAWGETYADLRRANGDTYHVTNCSPQIAGFNRSASGTDNWGDFENVVLSQAASERLCVFAGPVLDDDDITFLGRLAARKRIRVKIPSRFWKVVVARVEDGLAVFALMLEQNLDDVPVSPEEGEEFVLPEEFAKSVVPLKDIEAWTGLKFDTTLHDVDQYHTMRGPEAAARAGATRRRRRRR